MAVPPKKPRADFDDHLGDEDDLRALVDAGVVPEHVMVTAARTGDRRATLEALRDTLCASIDVALVPYRAPLASQLRAVLADLDAIPKSSAIDPVNELAERVRRKRAAAQG